MLYRVPGFLAIVLFGSPTTRPPSPASKMSFFVSLPVCRRSGLLKGEGERVGKEPNHTTARKPGPVCIIQYSKVEGTLTISYVKDSC
jgi:hypothetical protein